MIFKPANLESLCDYYYLINLINLINLTNPLYLAVINNRMRICNLIIVSY
jgi:hypothetical protein